MTATAAEQFHHHFLAHLKAAGFKPQQMQKWMWKPYALSDLRITGEGRDQDLSKLQISAEQIADTLASHQSQALPLADLLNTKTLLVLVPGFTHETLKNFSWHEQVNRPDGPIPLLMLHPGEGDGPTREERCCSGLAGHQMRAVYVRYPRSNAAAEHVVPALFRMLDQSITLRRWVDEGYRLQFVGYSYGSPLSLELLAGMASGRFADRFLLQATQGMLALCGDIGGSYLADDVLLPEGNKLVNIHKVKAFAERNRWARGLLGVGTPQLMDDLVGGVASLAHAERQAAMARYASQLPASVRYTSIGAVMPMDDYARKLWQRNLDDYAMYRQAEVSAPISVYQDGQVVLADNLIPNAGHLPDTHYRHLGAVRTHHWGVSYRTFNQGNNKFPRPAFYRALLQTLAALEA